MKNKILGIIGITGAALFAAGYATAVYLSERKEVKGFWEKNDPEDLEEDDFDEDDEFWDNLGEDLKENRNIVPDFGVVQKIKIENAYRDHGVSYDFDFVKETFDDARMFRKTYFRPKIYFDETGEHISSSGVISDETKVTLSIAELIYDVLRESKYGIRTEKRPKEIGEAYSSNETIITISLFNGEDVYCYLADGDEGQKILESILRDAAKIFTNGYDYQADVQPLPFADSIEESESFKENTPKKAKKTSPRKKKEEASDPIEE